MSGSIAEAPVIVGKMLAERLDGTFIAIAWMKFPEESDDAASPFEVLKGGRLERLDDVGPWAQWKKVAALIGPEGG